MHKKFYSENVKERNLSDKEDSAGSEMCLVVGYRENDNEFNGFSWRILPRQLAYVIKSLKQKLV